jgi:hypothetical protein
MVPLARRAASANVGNNDDLSPRGRIVAMRKPVRRTAGMIAAGTALGLAAIGAVGAAITP